MATSKREQLFSVFKLCECSIACSPCECIYKDDEARQKTYYLAKSFREAAECWIRSFTEMSLYGPLTKLVVHSLNGRRRIFTLNVTLDEE